MQVSKFLIKETATVIEAVKFITENGTQFGIIVDDQMKLKGVVTDGDIRQGILKNVDFNSSVSQIMNSFPKYLPKGYTHGQLIKLITKFKIKHLPIVDENMRVLEVYVKDETFIGNERQNPVVLMAGGLGSRLGALTTNCPKPLLKVGNKPILEIILENFIGHGFRNFYFTVNYMSEQIEDYFKDGSEWGVNITYIKESTKLGTAGGLSLVNFNQNLPLIIMNGDLLTKVNFTELVEFHQNSNSNATMCVRKYDFQVPYGVIDTDGENITNIIEKPLHAFFVNAGIYVLDPIMLTYISKNQHMDMTTLFEKGRSDSKALKVYPIHEYWLDIGRIEDFEKAQLDFYTIFK